MVTRSAVVICATFKGLPDILILTTFASSSSRTERFPYNRRFVPFQVVRQTSSAATAAVNASRMSTFVITYQTVGITVTKPAAQVGIND